MYESNKHVAKKLSKYFDRASFKPRSEKFSDKAKSNTRDDQKRENEKYDDEEKEVDKESVEDIECYD